MTARVTKRPSRHRTDVAERRCGVDSTTLDDVCLQSGATSALTVITVNHTCVKQNPKRSTILMTLKLQEELAEYGAPGPDPEEYMWKNV